MRIKSSVVAGSVVVALAVGMGAVTLGVGGVAAAGESKIELLKVEAAGSVGAGVVEVVLAVASDVGSVGAPIGSLAFCVVLESRCPNMPPPFCIVSV